MANVNSVCCHCLKIVRFYFNINMTSDVSLYKRSCTDCLELHRIGEGRDNRYWQHGWVV